MKASRMVVLGAVGVAIFSRIARSREPDATVTMHELDWPVADDKPWPRRYMSVRHLLHHLSELTRLTVPLFEVYVLKAITPAFRERIMVVTAAADDCPS